MPITVEGEMSPVKLRAARHRRAHLLATQGERIQRIAERCGVTVAVAKQFLNEKIIVKVRAEQSELPKGVRLVKGGAYQARPWIGLGPKQGLNVNLGIWHPEDYRGEGPEHRSISEELAIAAAGFAARDFLKRISWTPRPDILFVIRAMQAERRRGYPVVSLHVLPPLVRRVFAPAPPNDHHGLVDRELLGYAVGRRPDQPTVLYPTIEEAWAVALPIFMANARKSCDRRPKAPLAICTGVPFTELGSHSC